MASEGKWRMRWLERMFGARQSAADRELIDAAECFVEQFLFTGLGNHECDYAITALLKAYHNRKQGLPHGA